MADTTNRLAGTITLAVDGTSYAAAGEFAYSPGSVTRTTLAGQDAVHGYQEKPRAGGISGTLRDAGNLSVTSLNGMTNVTITLELANGKLVVGRNMWTVDAQESKTEDGTIEVKWEGKQGSVTEQ